MGAQPIELIPGIDVVSTDMTIRPGFAKGSLVRFFKGASDKLPMLQKRGGWTRYANGTVTGFVRGMNAWMDLSQIGYIGLGSEQALAVATAGAINDITPVASTVNLLNAFTSTVGLSLVTVNDPLHGRAVGDWVYVATLSSIAGSGIPPLQGRYQVKVVLDPNHYQIDSGTVAAATLTGGSVLNFQTQVGSNQVVVTLPGHVFVNGEQILVYDATIVGGLSLSGNFTIAIVGGNATITAPSIASGTANGSENGGQVQILHLLSSLLDANAPFGYGLGPFGSGAFGQGVGTTGIVQLRQWGIDHFGQIMVAAPTGGALYQWTPPVAYNNRATKVASAPQFSNDVFVAMPQEQVISAGSDAGGFQDPLLLKWSDVGDFTSGTAWTALATNQAGSFRLTRGSLIVGGLQGEQQGFVWTDIGMWVMNYIGFPLVYSVVEVAQGCGLIAKRAAAFVGGRLIWPGPNGFFEYASGGVTPLPCEVWDFFFANVDRKYPSAIVAMPNSDFTEIGWGFPVVGSNGVPMSYVSLNLSTGVWDTGSNFTRTSFVDRSAVAPPAGVDGINGLIQLHETQTDADGQAMQSFAETSWFKLNGGGDFISLDRLIPDFNFGPSGVGTVLVTVLIADYPKDTPRSFGPLTVTQATEFLTTQARGRLMKLHFDFSPFGSFARLGQFLQVGAPAGRAGG